MKREAHIKIIKPDLKKEKYMQRAGDAQSTPNQSMEQLHSQSKKSVKDDKGSQNADLLSNINQACHDASIAPSEALNERSLILVGGKNIQSAPGTPAEHEDVEDKKEEKEEEG